MLACSLSVGLLTLCWPPSLSVGVPEPGPALCRTPLRTHPQIRPCLGLYAECASVAPPPAADLVSDHRFGLAILAGPRPRLSTRPLLPYLECSGSSLSPLY